MPHLILTIALSCAAIASACAQTPAPEARFPGKPLRLIVPFVHGSGTDLLAREIAQPLAQAWGQPVVVDNRPGAGGMPGSAIAARAEPDGHTLLLANVAALALAPELNRNAAYEPLRDFAPVTQLSSTANAMVVHPAVQATSARQLIAQARDGRKPLRYASGGTGTAGHLAGELLGRTARINITHAPYGGSPAAMSGIIAGEVDMSFTSLVSTTPHIAAGRLRALAVTSLRRTRILPDVPTLDESGVKGFEVSGWQAILVPAGTPQPVILRLQERIAGIVLAPPVVARMAKRGLEMIGSTPDAFGRYLETEIAKWGTLIRNLGLSKSQPAAR